MQEYSNKVLLILSVSWNRVQVHLLYTISKVLCYYQSVWNLTQ